MTEEITFIGIDLAWRSERNHSGAAVLRGTCESAALVVVSDSIQTLAAVFGFIEANAMAATVVAVDAPLIIENATGQRPCESAVGRRYGVREASCHTSNRRLYPNPAGVALAEELMAGGYVHAPTATATSERVLLEVYPHAGLVALFDLPKTLKYKKGNLDQRRSGLVVLTEHLGRLSSAVPKIRRNPKLNALLARDVWRLHGAELKMHEDRLDGLFCAYLAYHYWYWGLERNEFFGDVASGYITNPMLLKGGIPALTA